MNVLADGLNNNASVFIVQNNSTKIQRIFDLNIPPNYSYNLLNIRGITPDDIITSLLKGVLKRKLNTGEISITTCDIDLSTLNASQIAFLSSKNLSSTLQVNTVADLSLLNDASLLDGTRIYVSKQKCFFSKDNSSIAALEDRSVVATKSGVGKWVRNLPSPYTWSSQLRWYISYTNGSDDNDGYTSLTPLKTLNEFTKRMAFIAPQPASTFYEVTLQDSLVPAADKFIWYPQIIQNVNAVAGANSRPIINFYGTQTTRRSGTFSATSQTSSTAQATATDNGGVSWASDIDKLVVMTSGANAGYTAWVGKDKTAGVAEVSSWVSWTAFPSASSTVAASAPAIGTYEVKDLTSWACEMNISNSYPAGLAISFYDINFTSPTAAGLTIYANVNRAFIRRCSFTPTTGAPSLIGAFSLLSSLISPGNGSAATPQTMTTTTPNLAFFVGTGSLLRNITFDPTGGITTYSGVLSYGGRIRCTVGTGLGSIQSIQIQGNNGFFDWAALSQADAAIVIRGCRVALQSTGSSIFGSSATASTYGVRIEEAGEFFIGANCNDPTVSGATADIIFEYNNQAIPNPPVAGTPTFPAVAALTTWTNWVNNFGRSVMSYRSGTKLIKALV